MRAHSSEPDQGFFQIAGDRRPVVALDDESPCRRFELVPIAEAPRAAVPDGEDIYCRSYVNFYLANGSVIAPAYGIAEDAAVLDTLHRAYPDREVVPLALRDLFRGGGGIHCITQQEPRGRGTGT